MNSAVTAGGSGRVRVAAALLALVTVFSVTATTLADDTAAGATNWLLLAAGGALACIATINRSRIEWWWSVAMVGAATMAGAVGGGFVHWQGRDLTAGRSASELIWLAAELGLVVALFRAGDSADTSRLRLSRLDGALVAVATATGVFLATSPAVLDSRPGEGAVSVLAAHGLIGLVVTAVVVRLVAVDKPEWIAGAAALIWSVVGFFRAWGAVVGHEWIAEWSAVGVALAVGLFAVSLTQRREPRGQVARLSDLPDEHFALLALCGLAPPAVAGARALLGEPVQSGVVATGMAVILVLVIARLHLVVRGVEEASVRDALIRQTTARIASARDEDAVRGAVVDAITTLMGPDLRSAAWVAAHPRDGYAFSHIADRIGYADPMRSGLVAILDARTGDGPIDFVEFRHGSAAILSVLERPWQGLVVACNGELPVDALTVLPTLATQCAMALEGIARANELLEKRSEARFQELVRHTNDAILIVDREGQVRYQTPSVVRMLGYLALDLESMPVSEMVVEHQRDVFDRFFHRLLTGAAERGDVVDLEMSRADGTTLDVEIVGSNLLSNPDVSGVVLTVRDVTRHRELEAQLRHQAFHDALTGLANRSLFVDRLDHALSVNRRSTEAGPAVAFIDLDDFKNVNDTLGHGAGDALLKTISRRLEECVRVGDTPARFGGDEFAVLFERAESVDSVLEAAERILEAVQAPVTIGDETVRVRASIGVATRHDGSSDAGEILRCADLAMYAAKAAGKGCVERFASEMHDAMIMQLSNQADLERAIAEEELSIAYQPVVDLDSGDVCAIEALVRWNHPERGAVPPSEFIPVAEEKGLIGELGAWVLTTAVTQLAEWSSLVAGPLAMHVNVSTRQLDSPSFVEVVGSTIADAGVDPSSVVLEIAEAALIGEDSRLLSRLHALRELGVRIAIDDFGTGHSSLRYLQRIPLDILKIDRSFVSSLVDVTPEESLVRTIIDLADRLGVEVVAEGVERPVERDGLRRLGCRLAQGFLYGSGVGATEVESLLDSGATLEPVAVTA